MSDQETICTPLAWAESLESIICSLFAIHTSMRYAAPEMIGFWHEEMASVFRAWQSLEVDSDFFDDEDDLK